MGMWGWICKSKIYTCKKKELENQKKELDKERESNLKELCNFDNFKVGLTLHGKLIPKRYEGGVILEETDFTINWFYDIFIIKIIF